MQTNRIKKINAKKILSKMLLDIGTMEKDGIIQKYLARDIKISIMCQLDILNS